MTHTIPTRARRLLAVAIVLTAMLFTACSYDEEVTVCPVTVTLVYPAGSIEPYEGVRVELKSATASIFVDSTDANGVARFTVPPGLYEASSTATLTTTDWRYFFNGVKSLIVISPDSTNQVSLPLTMSRKRIVN